MNSYYKKFNKKQHPCMPNKEEYDAYIPFTIRDKKTGEMRLRQFKEMTIKQMCYHNYIRNYEIIQEHVSKIEIDMNITDYEKIDDLLLSLARYCIKQKFYREGNEFHDFTNLELEIINSHSKMPGDFHLDGGYMFLHKEEEEEKNTKPSGFIRFYVDGCNPKWSFWYENEKLMVDYA